MSVNPIQSTYPEKVILKKEIEYIFMHTYVHAYIHIKV